MQRCPRHQTEFADDGYCPGCIASIALEETGEDQAAPLATLGNYELISELGRGGMGVVYLARQTALNRLVALKLLPSGSLSGQEFIQRFRREGELAASLQHPNIVKIFEAGETDGELFYSMELITGGSLADWPDGKTCKPLHAAGLLLKLTAAVEHAHQRGILHRDLKPANVLIDEDENPKVADFGLARLVDSSADMTLGTQSFGSPAYMAPELIRDPRATSPLSDIYSLGGILYFLLTGRSPFVSASLDELLRQVKECEPAAPRVLDPSVPKDLQKICLKALDKNPAKRYASARDFGDDLQRFLNGEPVLAVPSGPMTKLARFARRSPWAAAASISLVIALVGGVGGIAWQAKIANERADEITLQAAALRMNLYASDISAASLAIERGETPLADDILSRWENLPSGEDPRGFEWHLLKDEAQPAAHKLFGHRDATITNIAVSTDGKRLAIVDQSGKISIRPTHGERPFEFPNWSADEVAAIPQAFGGGWVVGGNNGNIRWMSPASKVIAEAKGRQFSLSARTTRAVVAETPRFHWWNSGGNATVLDWKTGAVLREIPGEWRQAVISPDGTTVALADMLGDLKLMDIDTGVTRDLPTPTPVWGLAFSMDGKRLAAGSRRSAVIWTLDEDVSAPIVIPHNLTVWMTAFSNDGTKFLTASSDRRVRVWRTKFPNSPPITLAGHHSEIWCAAFSPDGKSVFAGGKDGDVLGWKLNAPSSREIVPHDHATAPFFSPDGRKIVTWSRNTSHVLDLARNAGPTTGDGVQAIGYSRDGNFIICVDADGRMGRAPTVSPDKLSLYDVTPPPGSLRHIRSCGEGRWMVRVMNDGGITLENPADGSVAHRFTGPAKGKRIAVAASPDGRYFAVCGEGQKTVTLYDLMTHKVSNLGPNSSYYYVSLTFSKDGKLLASGDLAGPIQVWNVEDGSKAASLSGHSEESSIVLFSPNGKTLVSMGYHQDLKFWQTSTWRELHSVSMPDAAFCLAFSPDGRRLVTTLGRKKNEWLEWFPPQDPVIK